MARVAQFGAVETGTAYNRSMVKMHRPVKAAYATPDSFELGEERPEVKDITILEIENNISGAALCIASKCAFWRWTPKEGMREEVVTHGDTKRIVDRMGPINPTHGHCGIAGRPEVAV